MRCGSHSRTRVMVSISRLDFQRKLRFLARIELGFLAGGQQP